MNMDSNQTIKNLENFHRTFSQKSISECENTGHLNVSMSDLLSYDYSIYTELLKNTEEIISCLSYSAEELLISKQKVSVCLELPPDSIFALISDIRSEKLGALVGIEAQVKAISKVYSVVTVARFECPSCGNVLSVLQNDDNFREPEKCGCGRKGKFKLIEKSQIDSFIAILEDVPDKSKNQNLQSIQAIFKGRVTHEKIFNALSTG